MEKGSGTNLTSENTERRNEETINLSLCLLSFCNKYKRGGAWILNLPSVRIYTEFETLWMNIISKKLNPLGEGFRMWNQLSLRIQHFTEEHKQISTLKIKHKISNTSNITLESRNKLDQQSSATKQKLVKHESVTDKKVMTSQVQRGQQYQYWHVCILNQPSQMRPKHQLFNWS